LTTTVAHLPAQESTLLHFMRHSPQSLRTNPANLLDSAKSFMGIPFLSNINPDLNLGVAYSDAIFRIQNENGEDSLRVDNSIVNKLKKSTRMGVDLHYEILSFGIRFREDNMLTFSLSAKAFGTFLFPKDIAVLLLKGNRPGETLSINSDLNASAYMEAALGYSRALNENLKIGLRLKYLAGIANAYSDGLRAGITTAPAPDFSMKLTSNAILRTSCLDFEKDNPFKNSGMGFDAGLYYKSPVKGLEFSLSLIDWGYIQWNSKSTAYQSKVKNGEYEFKGITDIKNNNLDTLLHTLEDAFQLNEVENPDAYTSPLPGKIFFGTTYDFSPNNKLGFLFSTRALQRFSRTTFSLMYSRAVGSWLTVAAGNNCMIQKIFNPALALHFRLGSFQLHLVGENISSFYVKDISTANIQFGMNIAIY
jgi:hypothetical protein